MSFDAKLRRHRLGYGDADEAMDGNRTWGYVDEGISHPARSHRRWPRDKPRAFLQQRSRHCGLSRTIVASHFRSRYYRAFTKDSGCRFPHVDRSLVAYSPERITARSLCTTDENGRADARYAAEALTGAALAIMLVAGGIRQRLSCHL